MADRYIVFDVETPNSRNDRISSIGISVVENGKIIEEFYSLVNPEEEFNYFNIKLTGITPGMVEDAPTFAELWEKIGSIMESGILIAHNAPFDMGVLSKCLLHYGIETKEEFTYACTCRMAKKCMPFLPSHRLNNVSEHLGITLSHHDASSDSRAAAEILIHCMENGIDVSDFIKIKVIA